MPPLIAPAERDTEVIEVPIDNFKTFARKTRDELVVSNIGESALDVRFNSELGSITKRIPRAVFAGMDTLGTSKIWHAVRYYKNSTGEKEFIIAYETNLQLADEGKGTFSNVKTGLTGEVPFRSFTFKNLLYLFNGNDTSQVKDIGSNTVDIGVPTPGAPVATPAGAGSFTGAYQYKVSFEIDGYQEGNASAASNIVTAASQALALASIPISANSRATKRHLYRTKANGSVFYYLATISDNTTTTYDDTTTDGNLDTTRLAPSDYGAPSENFQHACQHKSRIFQFRGSTNKSLLIWSDVRSGVAYPDVYPVNNRVQIREDDGEEGTVIMEDHLGQLIAMKANSVIKIDTAADGPDAWSGFNTVISSDGCICPYSAARTPKGIIYVGSQENGKRRLVLWNGARTETVFEELEPLLSLAPTNMNDQFAGLYKDGIYYLAFNDTSDTSNPTINNRLLIIDVINMVWTLDKKNVQCLSAWSKRNDEGDLYTGTSDTTGFLYREDTSVGDLTIELLSELDAGTYSQCEGTGTEIAPKLTFIQAQLTDDIGATTISAASDVISTLTGDLDTIAPSCTYISDELTASSAELRLLLWNEVLGSNGEVLFWIRTGDTSAELNAAAWQGPYTNPDGSDISAIRSKTLVQIKIKMYVKDADSTVSEAPNIYLQRGATPQDYIAKISFGHGSIVETGIAMEYESNWLDFSWLDKRLKNRRKQFHWAKIEFNRTVATGSFTFGYRFDGAAAASRVDTSYNFSSVASLGYAVYQFPIDTAYAKRIKFRLYHNDDLSSLDFVKVTFGLSVMPSEQPQF